MALNVTKFIEVYSTNLCILAINTHTHTHTRLTALFRDYPGELVPER